MKEGGGCTGSGGVRDPILRRLPDEDTNVWEETRALAGEPLVFAEVEKEGGALASLALGELGAVAALRAPRTSSSRSVISSSGRFRTWGPI